MRLVIISLLLLFLGFGETCSRNKPLPTPTPTPTVKPTPSPAKVITLSVSEVEAHSALLSWVQPAPAGLRLEWSIGDSNNFDDGRTFHSGQTEYRFMRILPDTHYSFRLRNMLTGEISNTLRVEFPEEN